MQIVIEAITEASHQLIETPFASVSEWRMPEIVSQRQRFGKVRIQTQRTGHGARNLRDLQRMRQAIAKMVGVARGENLGLRFQPAKGARVNRRDRGRGRRRCGKDAEVPASAARGTGSRPWRS